MKKIRGNELKKFIEELEEEYKIVAPIKTRGKIFFKELASGDEMCLESNPVNSPKEFFLPYSESLFGFEKTGDELRLKQSPESEKKVLFGIRPCDVHALTLLDLIYGGEFKDPYYMRRREDTILVALTCLEPMEGCFCTSFDTGPSLKKGADLLLTDIGDCYLAESLTGKGDELIKSELFRDASEGDERLRDEVIREVEEKIPKLGLERIPEKMRSLFDSERWGELSKRCVSCAICTFLCPTCHCFDVVDDEKEVGMEGERIRCWDTCMSPSFTLQAGGENPRATKKERLRQRIYHKFSYLPERFNVFGCVGCGRCIRSCPVGIDLKEIITEIK
ncbi:MAG: 4Fe-4S dicluster domain-containing protein [Candidatus Altiarchaeota archaeon]|nr:4Fe-4S dicluster domain-containing protein [Candidatus Altiarchaeota archaeon]